MLDRLVGAHSTAKSLALFDVIYGQLKAAIRSSYLLEGQQHGSPVEQPAKRPTALPPIAQYLRGASVKCELSVAHRGVCRLQRLPLYALTTRPCCFCEIYQHQNLSIFRRHGADDQDVRQGASSYRALRSSDSSIL